MKQWFPLTDYDFYAHIAAGMVLIGAIDYACFGSVLVNRTEWTVVQTVFWAAMAYVTGHLIAGPAAGLVEHAITRNLLHSPTAIMLGFAQPRLREKIVRWVFAQREYAPYSTALQTRIKKAAAKALGTTPGRLTDADDVFRVAHPLARSNADAAARMDSFLNQYGFCRNLCFTAFISIGLLLWHLYNSFTLITLMLLPLAALLLVGMYGRFLKFYAAYAKEVLLTYNSQTMGRNQP